MSEQLDAGPDSEIVQLMAAGDERAIGEVLKQIVPEIWPLLQRRFADVLANEELEEVVSEALFKLWIHRESFCPDKGDVQGWFYVIARNIALDRVRAKCRRGQKSDDVLDVALADFECGEALSVREKATAIGRAFAKLNARERKVVAPLFQDAGDRPTMKQLGRTMKLSEGGVRALRFRGLRKLTRAMKEMGFVVFRPNVRETSSD